MPSARQRRLLFLLILLVCLGSACALALYALRQHYAVLHADAIISAARVIATRHSFRRYCGATLNQASTQ